MLRSGFSLFYFHVYLDARLREHDIRCSSVLGTRYSRLAPTATPDMLIGRLPFLRFQR